MRRGKKCIPNHHLANDSGMRCCIVACLRLIASARLPPMGFGSEITEFLSVLATVDELLASFTTAKERTRASESIKEYSADQMSADHPKRHAAHMAQGNESDQENNAALFAEYDKFAKQLKIGKSNRYKSMRIDSHCFITPPNEALSKVIRDANANVLIRLAQKLLVRWESAASLIDTKTVNDEQESSHNWLIHNVHILKSLFGFSEPETQVAMLALSFANVASQTDTVTCCVRELFSIGMSSAADNSPIDCRRSTSQQNSSRTQQVTVSV